MYLLSVAAHYLPTKGEWSRGQGGKTWPFLFVSTNASWFYCLLDYFFFFVNLTKSWLTWKSESQLRNYLQETGLWARLWGIFLIDTWCGRPQLTVCCATPGQAVLGCIKKNQLSKPWKSQLTTLHGSALRPASKVSASSPCPGFSEWEFMVWKCKPSKSLSPPVCFGQCHSNRDAKRNIMQLWAWLLKYNLLF